MKVLNNKLCIIVLVIISALIIIALTLKNSFAIDNYKPNTPIITSFAPSSIEPNALTLTINPNNSGNSYFVNVINLTLNRKDNYIPKFPLTYQRLIDRKEYVIIARVCEKRNNEYRCSDYTSPYKATATNNQYGGGSTEVVVNTPIISSAVSKEIGKVTLNYKSNGNISGMEIVNTTDNITKTTNDKNTYTFSNLEAGKTYNFKIRAYLNKDGKVYYSNYTNLVSVKVLNLNVKTPLITSLKSLSSTSVQLYFSKDKNSNIQVYNATDNKYVNVGNKDNYVYNALTQNKTYTFKVRSYAIISGKTYYTSWSAGKSIKTMTYKAEIEGKVKKLTKYSSYKLTKTYSKSNVKKIATLKKESKYKILQAFCFDGTNYLVQYKKVNDDSDKYGGKIKVFSKTGKLIKNSSVYGDLGHANGMTCHKNISNIYSANRGVKTTNPSKKYGKKLMVIDKKTLKKEKFITLSDYINAIAYDDINDLYYGTYGRVRLMVYNNKFKKTKTYKINLKSRYAHTQASGAYHGVLFQVYIKASKKNTNYIQLYRMSDGAYLGTYRFNMDNTELESVLVQDGYLVFLVNHKGDGKHYIYRSTSKVAIP